MRTRLQSESLDRISRAVELVRGLLEQRGSEQPPRDQPPSLPTDKLAIGD